MRHKGFTHLLGTYSLTVGVQNAQLSRHAGSLKQHHANPASPRFDLNVVEFVVNQESSVRFYVRVHTPASSAVQHRAIFADMDAAPGTEYVLDVRLIELESAATAKASGTWKLPSRQEIIERVGAWKEEQLKTSSDISSAGLTPRSAAARAASVGVNVRKLSYVDSDDAWVAIAVPPGLYAIIVDITPVALIHGARGSALPRWFTLGARVTADVEMSITPTFSLRAFAASSVVPSLSLSTSSHADGHCPCSRLSLTSISLSAARSSFSFSEPQLWLCAKVDSDHEVPRRRRVHSIPMPLIAPSVFYAKVAFEFPVAQFLLTLERIVYADEASAAEAALTAPAGTEVKQTHREVIVAEWDGSMSKNSQELKLALLPGVYRLNVDVYVARA
jgi:hypothetical protein